MNTNLWGNTTINDLIQDSMEALNILIQQLGGDPRRISIIGHSEGAVIAPRLAKENSTKVKNIVLMSITAQNFRDLVRYQALE